MPAVLDTPTRSDRIDTESKVIRNVKVLGLESKNVARVLGLDASFSAALNEPYRYSMDALRKSAKLYEGINVYSNHRKFDYDEKTGQRIVIKDSRTNEELIGWLKNVRAVEGKGLYADLYYVAGHPFVPTLVDLATREPKKLSLSHEAYADKCALKNGRVVIGEIPRVDSVALISNEGGTTSGLFESVALSESPNLVVEATRKQKPAPKRLPQRKPVRKAKPKGRPIHEAVVEGPKLNYDDPSTMASVIRGVPVVEGNRRSVPAESVFNFDHPRILAMAIRGVPISSLDSARLVAERKQPSKPIGYDDAATFAHAVRGIPVAEHVAPTATKRPSASQRALAVLSGAASTVTEALNELEVVWPDYP